MPEDSDNENCSECFSSIFGVSTPIPPEDGMLFEQLPYMRFEDGTIMLFE